MRYRHTTMGVPMSVDVRNSRLTREATEAVVAAAFARLDADDRRFSPYRDDSEISRINRDELLVMDASPELRQVLQIAEHVQKASGGAFNIRDPRGRLDANGVVKGWSAQHACNLLIDAGLGTFCFNAGGDIVAQGQPERGRGWHVAVRSPLEDTPLAVLNVQNRAVATSGTYERGPHIWDGRGGHHPSVLTSATVVADRLTTADVLATTVIALGPDGVRWAAETYGCAVLALDSRSRLHVGGPLRSLLAV